MQFLSRSKSPFSQLLTSGKSRPVFTYLKSRGFYAGVQVDGTVIIERTDENERFYGQRIGVADILAGKARHPPYEIKMLMETVKAAEGRTDVDKVMMDELADEPAPADLDLQSPTTAGGPVFGIPEPDDPDPFGVLALEKEGLEIREAGTRSRPSSTQFEYNPSPTSPIYNKFHRRSIDTLASRSNRESYMSNRTSVRTSTDRVTQTAEMGTQTDETITPSTSPSHSDKNRRILEEDERSTVIEPEEIDYTKVDLGPYTNLNHSEDFDGTTMNGSPREGDGEQHGTSVETSYITEDDEEEEPVIFEAASAQATILTPQAIKARGGLVNIPRRLPPPPLPPRNSARTSNVMMVDAGSGRSPMKSEFEEVDVHGVDRRSVDVSEKDIVMEDLEKDEPLPEGKVLEDEVDEALKEQHLEKIESISKESTGTEKAAEDAIKHESEEMKPVVGMAGHEDESDTFHSVPTTPNAVEVK
jgi:hypothetical protein